MNGRLRSLTPAPSRRCRIRAVLRRHAYLILVMDADRVDDVLPDRDDGRVGIRHPLPRADQQFPQDAPGFFIGAVLLGTPFRGQLGVSLTFIEEPMCATSTCSCRR
jgi:hypothetical protein